MLVVKEGTKAVRLKCSKSILNILKIPPRGILTVVIKRCTFQANYDVSCSSFRVYLDKSVSNISLGDDGRVDVTFVVGKEEEKSHFIPCVNRAYYDNGFKYCSLCMVSWKVDSPQQMPKL